MKNNTNTLRWSCTLGLLFLALLTGKGQQEVMDLDGMAEYIVISNLCCPTVGSISFCQS